MAFDNALLWFYLCVECGRKLAPNRLYHACPDCGGLLLIERNIAELRNRFPSLRQFHTHITQTRNRGHNRYPFGSGVWRWLSLILPDYPIEHVHSIHEGNTDLWVVPEWKKKEWRERGIALDNIFIKCTGQTPTGSFKDFGMTVLVSEALRQIALHPNYPPPLLVCASTGDTSASLARYVASRRDVLTCVVLVPHNKISPAQLYQILDSGALVLQVESPDGFDACLRVVRELQSELPNVVLANSVNAMRIVGQETISLNIYQDLGWNVPDWLVIPCGNAGNLTAQMSAWRLLKNLELIDRLPKIIVAQTRGANTLVRWIREGFNACQPGKPTPSVASAMNIQNPASFDRVAWLRLHAGFELVGYDVEESAITATRAELNRAGAGLCPQGAVAFDAVFQARRAGTIQQQETVVVVTTALDIKFPESGADYHLTATNENANPPQVVTDNLASVIQAIARAERSFP